MLKRLTPLCLAALVGLSACGGDDDTTATTTSPDATPATSAVVTTGVPAPTTAATTVPATAAPATTAPPTVATTPPTTAVVTTAPATPGPDDGDAAPGTVEPIRVTLPGTSALSNETAVRLVAALQEFSGVGADPAADLARFGLDVAPHVLVEGAALFELTGGVDAATDPAEPDFNLALSYLVESDAPDPEAVLAALQEAILPLGEYEVSTRTRSEDDLTAYYLDLRPAEYGSGLPTWNLWAIDIGAGDEQWAGIVELHIETYGATEGLALPEGLADLDAQARTEAPYELAPYQYRVDNSINMFGGFPSSSASVSYRIVDDVDFATAQTAFTEALGAYGEPYVDDDGEYATWDNAPFSWQLNLNFEDDVVARFTQARHG